MQNEFTDNWKKMCQCVSKPMLDLTELNMTTLNNVIKHTHDFQELSQAKKPEDIMAAQIKLANVTCQEATQYAQKAMEIGLDFFSNTSQTWLNVMNNMTNKTSEFTRASMSEKMKSYNQ